MSSAVNAAGRRKRGGEHEDALNNNLGEGVMLQTTPAEGVGNEDSGLFAAFGSVDVLELADTTAKIFLTTAILGSGRGKRRRTKSMSGRRTMSGRGNFGRLCTSWP